MSVTIRDIAKKLGLSIAAVSAPWVATPIFPKKPGRKSSKLPKKWAMSPIGQPANCAVKKQTPLAISCPPRNPVLLIHFSLNFSPAWAMKLPITPFDLLVSIAPPGAEAEQTIYRQLDTFPEGRWFYSGPPAPT